MNYLSIIATKAYPVGFKHSCSVANKCEIFGDLPKERDRFSRRYEYNIVKSEKQESFDI